MILDVVWTSEEKLHCTFVSEIESDTREHRYLASKPGIYDRHIEMLTYEQFSKIL